MDALLELAGLLGPTIAGLLTVPITRGITHLVAFLDNRQPAVKQLLAVLVAWGLTQLGALLQVVLPTSLELFTGDTTEALIAAAIAFGVHAGQKARGTAPKLLVFLMAFPVAAACQTGSGEVIVIDRSRLVVDVIPASYTGEPGDTVTFTAVVRDTISGDTIQAVLTWSSSDPVGVQVNPVTGLATLQQAGTYRVDATVAELVSMFIMYQDDQGAWVEAFSTVRAREGYYAGLAFPPGPLEMLVGETERLCPYIEIRDQAPFLTFLARDVEWSSSDTTVVTVTGNVSETCPPWNAIPASNIREALRQRGRVGIG